MLQQSNPRLAVVVPCHNEEATIAQVVRDFQLYLPSAEIFVFDNNSTDTTVTEAATAGARVFSVSRQGKGHVIRRMFADVDADVYVLVDGDATYDASVAPVLIDKLVKERLDMVVGARVTNEADAYRHGHRFGNVLLTGFAGVLFGREFKDMLSGYRIFSRRYAKSFPAHSPGFEVETEMTVHALQLEMPVAEVSTVYGARPEGSSSKLNTYQDGARILLMIIRLFKSEEPFAFFSLGAILAALLAVILIIPIIETYLRTGLVPRFPTAILCAALILLSAILVTCGIVLDAVTRARREVNRFAYLAVPAFHGKGKEQD